MARVRMKRRSVPDGKPTRTKRGNGALDLKTLCREYTERAVQQLWIIATTSASDHARVGAIKEILDRGHGKSTQRMSGEEEGSAIPLSITRTIVDPLEDSVE